MYAYTPSNKNLARAPFTVGFRHFIKIPNAYIGIILKDLLSVSENEKKRPLIAASEFIFF